MNSTFEFGSELRGRGYTTNNDYFIGSLLCALSATAVLLGSSNLYLIKKMDTFHNAFGWFWASRTVGEVGFNVVHLLYSVPVTLLQPKNLPSWMGIAAFDIGYFFAHHACAMHQVVSLNRCVAVCLPMKYQRIFSSKICKFLIAFLWIQVFTLGTFYHLLPCSLVGYSPTLYEFVYIHCDEHPEKTRSLAATIVNRLCFSVCLGTVVSDLITIARIVYIRLVLKLKIQDKGMRRDIRFFAQSSVQNVTMMIALTLVILVNNSTDMNSQTLFILSLDVLIMTHINNALALLLFNPEVRRKISTMLGFRPSQVTHQMGATDTVWRSRAPLHSSTTN